MKIKNEEYYSIMQLYQLDVFKWLKSYSSFKALIKRDVNNGNKIFQVIKTGEGNGTRYFIKGETILELIKEIKSGGKIF